jgi:hypothetical protein
MVLASVAWPPKRGLLAAVAARERERERERKRERERGAL